MTEFKFRVAAARGSGKWLPLRLAVAGPAARRRASLTRFKSVGSLNFTVARAAPAAVAAAVQRGRSAGESGPGANLKLASLSE